MITTAEKDVLIAYIQSKNERIAELEHELAEAKKRGVILSAGPIGMPKQLRDTDFSFYNMDETDEQFAKRAGKPYQEVTE